MDVWQFDGDILSLNYQLNSKLKDFVYRTCDSGYPAYDMIA